MTGPAKPMHPLAMAVGAVEARIKAAEQLFTAALFERDIAGLQKQREVLHALLDEKLDITAGMLTKLMRGEL